MGLVLARLSDSAPHARGPASRLSPTELDILTMIGETKPIRVISAARGISHKIVRNHLANIHRKLELRSRTEAAVRSPSGVTTLQERPEPRVLGSSRSGVGWQSMGPDRRAGEFCG
jgi:DNA-binding CsgD family transcriptional regulator